MLHHGWCAVPLGHCELSFCSHRAWSCQVCVVPSGRRHVWGVHLGRNGASECGHVLNLPWSLPRRKALVFPPQCNFTSRSCFFLFSLCGLGDLAQAESRLLRWLGDPYGQGDGERWKSSRGRLVLDRHSTISFKHLGSGRGASTGKPRSPSRLYGQHR